MPPDTGFELIERSQELAVLEGAVASAQEGKGGVVVVEGPPGIGKSALMAAAADRACALEISHLRARGEQLEQRYPYGVVRQLLAPKLAALDDADRKAVLSGIAGEAARALEGGLRPELSEEPEGLAAIHHGLYWIVYGLSERNRLLLTVDDAHWSDEPSLRWLVSLARRVDDLPVVLVVAARGSNDGANSILDELSAASGAQLVKPQPLTVPGVGHLLQARLGAAPDPRAVRLAHERTAGNPLFVEELVSALRGAATPERVAAVTPTNVPRLVRARLNDLGEGARSLAKAAAVLGDGAALGEAAFLAAMELDDAAAAAGQLIAADILSDAPNLTFRHPLVREAMVGGLTTPLRRAEHRRAAAFLHDRGASNERIAGHLLASEPLGEPWAVHVLRSAASDAVSRGSPDVAADLLTRALLEPPPAERRVVVLAELGAAELQAGRASGVDHVREAIQMQRDPHEKARLALFLGEELAGMQREREAAVVLAEGLDWARDIDRELALRLEAHLAHAERYELGGEAASSQRLARLSRGLSGVTPAERLVLAMDAALRPPKDAAEAAIFAGRVEAAWSENLISLRAATGAVATYLHADELRRADAFSNALLEYTQRHALAFGHARVSAMVAMVALARGRLADAEAALVGAVDVETYGAPRPAVALLIETLAEMDRLDEAEDVLTRYGADGPLPSKMLMNPLLMARARFHAARNRPNQAVDDLLELGRRYERWGLGDRPMPPWRGLAASLMAGLGEADRAARLADEQLLLARRWGTERAIGIALSVLGTVHQDVDALDNSVRRLAPTPFRLDHARSLVELGTVKRRQRRRADAIAALNAGMDLAHRCGARALAERARSELLAAGSRPRRLARTGRFALTGSELRVAQMAANGMSNPEIAQALFVTRRTVETHLTSVYGKLGIARREHLAVALEPEVS
jgi:DNA-binding CsgD family transcriptional regulator